MIKGFLHTGFEVDNLDDAIVLYEKLGFVLEKQFDKLEPHAKAAHMISVSGGKIELWQFLDKDHPQVQYISSHIAVESDDLEVDIRALVDAGCKIVIPATKGKTLTYVFVQDPSGNNIEIGQR